MNPNVLPLTAEQKELFAYIDSLIPEHGHLAYDLSDPKQYQFAVLMNTLGGFAESNYPGFHAHLETIKNYQLTNGYHPAPETETTESFQTDFDIQDVGRDTAGLAAGIGYGTVVGGFQSANLSFVIQDPSTSTFLAHGSNAAFASSYLDVATDKTSAKAITPNIVGYMNYVYQPNDPANPGGSGVIRKLYNGYPVADPTLSHPVRISTTPSNPRAINIGINRMWSDQDIQKFDYYWQDTTIQQQPTGRIPLVGNVTFNAPIVAPLIQGQNFWLTITVTNTAGGGTVKLSPQDMDNIYNNFYVDPNNPSKLCWNLPPANQGIGGNPIVFTGITWPSDMTSIFYCNMWVNLQGGGVGTATIVSSNHANSDQLDGVLYIMPIEFIWHCLGEGTQVLLSDGKNTKAIEDFIAGDAVAVDNNGNSETVTFTNKGAHYGAVMKITTNKGHSLILSHNHVVMTPAGEVAAVKLATGDEVIVRDGTAQITSVEEIQNYQGYFYNLCIGQHHDCHDVAAPTCTFFANGILVGDIKAQRVLQYRHSHDKEWLKANLDACWAKDIDSYFAAQERR